MPPHKVSQSLCANHGCSNASRAVILLAGSKFVILQTRSRNRAFTKSHFSNGFRRFAESKLAAIVIRRSKNGFFSPIHCSKPLKPSSSPKKDICRRRMYRHESLAANSHRWRGEPCHSASRKYTRQCVSLQREVQIERLGYIPQFQRRRCLMEYLGLLGPRTQGSSTSGYRIALPSSIFQGEE